MNPSVSPATVDGLVRSRAGAARPLALYRSPGSTRLRNVPVGISPWLDHFQPRAHTRHLCQLTHRHATVPRIVVGVRSDIAVLYNVGSLDRLTCRHMRIDLYRYVF